MKIHIVKKGDTLYEISKKYNVGLDKLIAANPQIADPDNIDVGAKVKIPTAVKPLPSTSVEYVHKHVVVQGDTLWKLSKAWNVPLKSIIDANPHIKNPSVLLSGDIVYIPKLNPDGTVTNANPHEGNIEHPHKKKLTAPKEELLEPIVPEPAPPEIPAKPEEPVKAEEPEKVPEPVKPEEPEKSEQPVKAEEPEKVPEKVAEYEPLAKPEVAKKEEKGEPLPSYEVSEYPQQAPTIHSGYDPFQPYSQPSESAQPEAAPYSQYPFAQFNIPASEVSVQQPVKPLVQPTVQPSVQPHVQPTVQTAGEAQVIPGAPSYGWDNTQLPKLPELPGLNLEYPGQTSAAGQITYPDYPGQTGAAGQYAAQPTEALPYTSQASAVPLTYGGCGCGGSGVTSWLPYAINPWENAIPAVPGAGEAPVSPYATPSESDVSGAPFTPYGAPSVTGAGEAPVSPYGAPSVTGTGGAPVSPYGAPSVTGVSGAPVSPYGAPSVPGVGGAPVSPYGAPSVTGVGGAPVSPYGTPSVPGVGGAPVSPYGTPSVPGVGGAPVSPYGAPSVPGVSGAPVSPYGAPSVTGGGGAPVSPYGVPSVPGVGGAPYGFQPGAAAQPFAPGGYVYHPYPLGATSETIKKYATPYASPYGLYGAESLPGQTGGDSGGTDRIEQLSVQSNIAGEQDNDNAAPKTSTRSAKGKAKSQKAVLHAIASKLKEKPEKRYPKDNLPWINV